MPVAKVVTKTEAGIFRSDLFANLIDLEEPGNDVSESLCAVIDSLQSNMRHGVAQYAGGGGVTFGVIRIQQTLRRYPLDHLRELPSQIHCILHANVEALSTHS